MQETHFRDLTLCAYRAGIEGSGWQDFVDMLDAQLDGVYVSLFGHDLRGQVAPHVIGTRYEADSYSEYQEHYATINPFIPVLMQQPLLRIERSEVWVPEAELKAGEFYNEFLRPREDIGTGGGGVLFNDKDRLLILSGQVRSHEQEKADQLVEAVRHVAPHVRQAFEMRRMLQGNSLSGEVYRGAFEAVSNALIIIDERGRVCDCNSAAEELFASRHLIGLDQFGALRFLDPWGQAQLAHLLEETVTQGFAAMSNAIFTKDLESTVHVARLSPLKAQIDNDAPLFHFVGGGQPAALLAIRPKAEVSAERSLQLAFKLTPAEAALAQGLFNGLSLKDYADSKALSLHTARTQLKTIFSKTDTRRQSELVALLGKISI